MSSLGASCAFLELRDFLMNDCLSIDEFSSVERLPLRITAVSIIGILRSKSMSCRINAKSSGCQQCNVPRR